jgi:hypothetical protein
MGRPKDRKERELERALEVLDKSIKRRDGERAVEALLLLPTAVRMPSLAAVAPLFAIEVQRAQAAHDLGRLSRFAAQAVKEPGLLAALARPAIPEVRWALLWGAAQRGDFAAAEGHLHELQPDLEKQTPTLLAWLSAWVRGRGAIPDAGALPPLPAESERLGYDRRTRARAPEPPTRPEQVEPAVITAAATLRPLDFRALMLDWVRSLPAPLAHAVRVLAGKLAMREALRCAPERRHHAALSLLAAMASLPPATSGAAPQRVEELAEEVLLGLRIANAGRGGDFVAEEARLVSSLVLLAVQDPAHRRVVIAYVATLRFPAALQQRAAELHEKLLALEPDPELLATAIEHYMKQDESAGPPPGFLVDTLARLVERPAAETAAWLRALAPARQASLFAFLRDEAPPALGLDLADRAFADADAQLRHALAELVVHLIEALPSGDPQALSRVRTVGDYLKLMRRLDQEVPFELQILLQDLPPHLPFPEPLRRELSQALRREGRGAGGGYDSRQRAEVQRFSARMLVASRSFAGLAIKAARSEKDALETARSYLDQVTQIDDALTFLWHAYEAGRNQVYPAIIEQTLSRFGHDENALARAVYRLDQEDAPLPFLKPFARALLVIEIRFTGDRSPEYRMALSIAKRLVPARERRALGLPGSPPKARSTRKPKAGAGRQSSRTSKEPAVVPAAGERQLDLSEIFR